MTIGFERDGCKYFAVSCGERSEDIELSFLLSHEANYPIKKIKKFPNCVVSVPKSSNALFELVNILENLDSDKLDYNILYNKVLPQFHEQILISRGIESGSYLNSSATILYNHKFYTFFRNGLIDINDTLVLGHPDSKCFITEEFLSKNKNLDYKETILGLDKFLVQLNYPSSLPYVVYKENDDTFELLGELI